MRQCGFTLIELLVVISIIAILISLLLFGIAKSRQTAINLKCATQLKAFGYSYASFAADHKEYMPGLYTWQDVGLQDWQRDVYSGPNGNRLNPNTCWPFAPQDGTLFSYLQTGEIYLCPALRKGELGTGIGSNGHFDYSIIGGWSGAKFDNLPVTIILDGVPNTTLRVLPIVIEEDTNYYLNTYGIASSFAGPDQVATRHFNSSNYAAYDGSVQRFSQEYYSAPAYKFIATTNGPIGMVNFAPDAPFFGWWNSHWND